MYCNIINIHLHLFLCRCPPFLTAICSFFFDRSFCSLTLSAHIYEQGYQLPAQFFLNYDGPVKECDEFFSMFMLLNMLIGSYMRFNNWDMILVNYFAFNRIFFRRTIFISYPCINRFNIHPTVVNESNKSSMFCCHRTIFIT